MKPKRSRLVNGDVPMIGKRDALRRKRPSERYQEDIKLSFPSADLFAGPVRVGDLVPLSYVFAQMTLVASW